MYRWNINKINNIIYKLQNRIPINKDEQFEINYCITELKKLLENNFETNNYILEENEEYKDLIQYNNIILPILNKYETKTAKEYPYLTIDIPEHDILFQTKKIIKNINKDWYNKLLPIFNNQDILDFKNGNNNALHYLDYINKIYISLDKQNNIEDFLNSIHEYLHAYTILINPNYLYNIECEFLSMLGELIMSYELKKKNIYTKEIIKSELNTYSHILSYIKNTIYKKAFINANFTSKEKIDFLTIEKKLSKEDIDNIYSCSLTYNYSTIISYFIALELFEIYKIDKEKCLYICNYLIKNNNSINTKLAKQNIILLENDTKYISSLKKEYVKYNQ